MSNLETTNVLSENPEPKNESSKKSVIKKVEKPGKKLEKPKNLIRIKKNLSKNDEKTSKIVKSKILSPRQIQNERNSKILDSKFQKQNEINLKKIDNLTTEIEKLKKELEQNAKEIIGIKNDRLLKEMEIEKLNQFWQITKNQLDEEILRNSKIEEKYEKIKTAHMEEVSLLKKQIKFIKFNSKIVENFSTQTDPFVEDSLESGFSSKLIQVEQILTKRDANEKLRIDDERLAELIVELENDKLRAQSDYKFSVVQVETRLKIDKANEIRRFKEEKLKEIEELTKNHQNQLLALEEENEASKLKISEQLSQQKIESIKIKDELEKIQKQMENLTNELKMNKEMVSEFQESKTKLENKLKTEKLKEKTIKKEENTTKDLKNRIKLLEELNEIVLGEFRMIEKSKNDLIGDCNQTNREMRPDLLVKSEKAAEFERKFDQIMKRRR